MFATMISDWGISGTETSWTPSARAAEFPTEIRVVDAVEVRCGDATGSAPARVGPRPGRRLRRLTDDHAGADRDRAGRGYGRDRPSPSRHRGPDA